eukprot:13806336-Heterocapsa_arctica.AAC.1
MSSLTKLKNNRTTPSRHSTTPSQRQPEGEDDCAHQGPHMKVCWPTRVSNVMGFDEKHTSWYEE